MDWDGLDRGAARTAAELRIQLAQMTAASQMLERCAWDEKSRGYLAALNQGICRMLRTVGRLELAGRLSKESPQLELAAADLGELTAELGQRMEGLLERTGVRLAVSGPEGLTAQVDETLIRQMLLELTANAAAAGKTVRVTLEKAGNRAVFTVADDGPGISPESVAGLFSDEREQIPDWRRGGMGLAIAHRIASLHGGTLMADCAPGQGMRVSASIPLGEGEGGVLKGRALRWDGGGFDEALVGLSSLLPAQAFLPENLE